MNSKQTNPKKRKKRRGRSEYLIHKELVSAIRQKYPLLPVITDLGGMVTDPRTASMHLSLRSHKGFPDIIIPLPTMDYSGLLIEVKSYSPFTQEGNIKKNPHLVEQFQTLMWLRQLGYKVIYVWDVNKGIEMVDQYIRDSSYTNSVATEFTISFTGKDNKLHIADVYFIRLQDMLLGFVRERNHAMYSLYNLKGLKLMVALNSKHPQDYFDHLAEEYFNQDFPFFRSE